MAHRGRQRGYTGYTDANHAFATFFNGFLLHDVETGGGFPGPERLVDGGSSVPVGTFHQVGDIHFNQNVDPVDHVNQFLAWTNSYAAYTTLGAAVTSGTTTSVPVAACPSPALPAGTPILDNVSYPNIDKLLGTLASCTSTTLTFQAVAANNASSGDQILFMQWLPAGPSPMTRRGRAGHSAIT